MFATYSYSQNALYGVRVGFNASNLDFEPEVPGDISNRHRNGFAVGFFAELEIAESLSFAPEIQFSAEGAKEENVRIDYIQMPLFLKYEVSEGISLGLGPQLGFKGHDYEDGLKNLGFSGLAGLEYKLSEEFFLDLRYSYGFTNVFDAVTNIEAKNRNIQIGFGLKF